MYTTDQKLHQADALGFNKNADADSPLFMTAQGFICFKPYLAEKRPTQTGGEGSYEIAVAFPADCPGIKDIMARTKTFLQSKFDGQRGIRKPFKKGDDYVASLLEDADNPDEMEEKYGKMRGHIFLNAKTKFPLNEEGRDPQLIDHNLAELNPEKVFGGAIVRIQIAPYAYNQPGNKGVAFGLRAVQVLKKSDWSGNGGGNAAGNFGSASSQDETETAADAFAPKKEAAKETVEETIDKIADEAADKIVEAVEATGAQLADDDMFDD
jgi:hypothetical protein